ncbi:MAG: dihydroorotate dehydrogenase [Bacteroidia bacterium]|jgi:dihydroorotate dehydrogenase
MRNIFAASMYRIFKKLLFLLPAETAHSATTQTLKLLKHLGLLSIVTKVLVGRIEHKPLETMGLKFKNALGLAAGFDKNADYLEIIEELGFGHIEIGTVTPKAQAGNPKPRLFRLPKDEALINRMGFNNKGVDYAVERLKVYRKRHPNTFFTIGGNIGKNKVTENDEAHEDYKICYEKLYPFVDYFVVNVSSPNTPSLRALQERDSLAKILSTLRTEETKCKELHPNLPARPLLVKISPDNENVVYDDILSLIDEYKLDGLVGTNTTISREGLNTDEGTIESIGNGGLSGLPVQHRSDEVVEYLRKRNKEICIIGVGGITDAASAQSKIHAGANLVQVYSGLIYSGPKLISDVLNTD